MSPRTSSRNAFRKIALALGAFAIVAAASAAAPTVASAKGWKHHGWHHGHHHGWNHGWRHGFRVGFYAPPYYGDCYIVRRVVWTKWGKRIRRVQVCD